jgi:hypothetical protein
VQYSPACVSGDLELQCSPCAYKYVSVFLLATVRRNTVHATSSQRCEDERICFGDAQTRPRLRKHVLTTARRNVSICLPVCSFLRLKTMTMVLHLLPHHVKRWSKGLSHYTFLVTKGVISSSSSCRRLTQHDAPADIHVPSSACAEAYCTFG